MDGFLKVSHRYIFIFGNRNLATHCWTERRAGDREHVACRPTAHWLSQSPAASQQPGEIDTATPGTDPRLKQHPNITQ
ncbi:hypothetical protein SKAU_G00224280 [Synaphobranchus kaupii]|uniref:Uncharacterized protein n=1 Tax=Synaphobranchus kaupii TaxID=118154 RepID=A0A9Q1FBU8_SYNKA|nr:hypothetical protein SKAU_G00224280 [Synaphobranchus kaupii]